VPRRACVRALCPWGCAGALTGGSAHVVVATIRFRGRGQTPARHAGTDPAAMRRRFAVAGSSCAGTCVGTRSAFSAGKFGFAPVFCSCHTARPPCISRCGTRIASIDYATARLRPRPLVSYYPGTCVAVSARESGVMRPAAQRGVTRGSDDTVGACVAFERRAAAGSVSPAGVARFWCRCGTAGPLPVLIWQRLRQSGGCGRAWAG
jgi:hypothetical protein